MLKYKLSEIMLNFVIIIVATSIVICFLHALYGIYVPSFNQYNSISLTKVLICL